MKEIHWIAATAIAAIVAALAATAQSYVAWSSRNDLLKASILSAAVARCVDARIAARNAHNAFVHLEEFAGKPPPTVEYVWQKLNDEPQHQKPGDSSAVTYQTELATRLENPWGRALSELEIELRRFDEALLGWRTIVPSLAPDRLLEINQTEALVLQMANSNWGSVGPLEDGRVSFNKVHAVVVAVDRLMDQIDQSCMSMLAYR